MSESQIEDGLAKSSGKAEAQSALPETITPFDARRPDRIPRSQLRAIELIYESFVRSVTSSLSAYLRSYTSLTLGSIEQLSYREFLDGLPGCSSTACASVVPYGGQAIFEIGPTLTFPILEILLGGSGETTEPVERELTEIEQMLMDSMFRIITHDSCEAWKQTAKLDFEILSIGGPNQLVQSINPADPVLAAKIEMLLGENVGSIHIALPSLAVHKIGQRSDQERSTRKSDTPPEEQARALTLIQTARVKAEARLPGQQIRMQDLLALESGDVLVLDVPIEGPVQLLFNDELQFIGEIVRCGRKRAMHLSGAAAT